MRVGAPPKTQPEVARPKGSLQQVDTGETAAMAEGEAAGGADTVQVLYWAWCCGRSASTVPTVAPVPQAPVSTDSLDELFWPMEDGESGQPHASTPAQKRLRSAPASSPSSLPLHRTLARLDQPQLVHSRSILAIQSLVCCPLPPAFYPSCPAYRPLPYIPTTLSELRHLIAIHIPDYVACVTLFHAEILAPCEARAPPNLSNLRIPATTAEPYTLPSRFNLTLIISESQSHC
ncbi:hypothetical protein IQ07DRAFT_356566 [Pyrenochaeta sp. DS3sAY3a]|nr:hypothetical protein IQ07DRAFT_356566 [Pyrenochaeta sp. DS3sAY3a]